jgi:hypothetical protein
MHVLELLDFLALTPQIEIVRTRKPNMLARNARNVVEAKYSSRKAEFDRLNYGGRIRDLRLRDEKVYMLGHDYVADYRERYLWRIFSRTVSNRSRRSAVPRSDWR